MFLFYILHIKPFVSTEKPTKKNTIIHDAIHNPV